MASTVESDLRSLLEYYGEAPDSPEAPKPEDFFGLVLSFSSSLQVSPKVTSSSDHSTQSRVQKCAVEVHDAQRRKEASQPTIKVQKTAEEPASESVSSSCSSICIPQLTIHLSDHQSASSGQLASAISFRAAKSFCWAW